MSSLDLAAGLLSPSSRASQLCRELHGVILTHWRQVKPIWACFPCLQREDPSKCCHHPHPLGLAGRGSGLSASARHTSGRAEGRHFFSPFPSSNAPRPTVLQAEKTRVGINSRCSPSARGAGGRMMPASDRAETLNMSPLAFLSTKHKTNVEAVSAIQERKPN